MNAIQNLSNAAKADLARALRNHNFEISPQGVFIPGANVFVGGGFRHWVNRRDERIDPNTMTLEGLTYLIKAGVAGFGQISNWYVALFSDNESPTTALTAATFPATLTEFTNYAEGTREAWAQDAEASQAITNDTTKAEFTCSAGGGTVWGAALTSAAAKSATTGTLLAASKFSAVRTLAEGDVLALEYTLTAADA